ncbi:MAG: GNAT family N-acetyltransferase [Cytophagales bacterium]
MIEIKHVNHLPKEFVQLCHENEHYTIHQSLPFVNAYLKYFLGENHIFCLLAYDKGRLVSVLASEIKKTRFLKLFSYFEIQELGHSVNDFYNIPGDKRYSEEISTAFLNWFKNNSASWNRINSSFIPSINETGNLLTAKLAKEFDGKVYSERNYFKIDTSISWEEYFTAEINKKLRDVRGRLNRIKRNGHEVKVEYINSGILNYLPDFLIHFSKRRTDKQQSNSYENFSKKQLIEYVVKNQSDTCKVQLALLKDEKDNIWAYQLDLLDTLKGIWYHYAPVFNDKYYEFSPGKVLLFLTLQDAFANKNILEFNFMRGESSYKQQFTDSSEKYLHCRVVNDKTWKYKLNRMLLNLKNLFN